MGSSINVEITDLPNRKMEAAIARFDGAVKIKKKWMDDQGEWHVRDMIVNGDEWDRICEERKKITGR